MGWEHGDVIDYRHVKHGRPWWRTPARVVEDSDDLVALWWPAGTKYLRPVHGNRNEALRLLAEGSWELETTEWWGGDSLHVVPTGAPFALWPYRNAENELIGWYCNLQAPLVRTADGFDTNDWTLDIMATPDLSGWTWKDEDELVYGEQVGLYSAEDVALIRAAGAEVIAMIEARHPLFERWAPWRPDPGWSPPKLP